MTAKSWCQRLILRYERVALVVGLSALVNALAPESAISGSRDIEIRTLRPSVEGHVIYEKMWAVVIGINSYPKAPPLEYAVNDARSVAQRLQQLGFPPDNVLLVEEKQATKASLLSLLTNDLPRRMAADDAVLVFFAGHGVTQHSSGKPAGVLLPYDGDARDPSGTGISMDVLQLALRQMKAKHVLLVVDACYSGLALHRSVTVADDVRKFAQKLASKQAVQVITAGGANETAVEFGGHGLFTEKFLLALEGLADLNGDGIITATEIGSYVREKVTYASRFRQTPLYGTLAGEGEFLFVVTSSMGKELARRAKVLAKYEEHYHAALTAIEQGLWLKAKEQLELALGFKPGDLWIKGKLDYIEQQRLFPSRVRDRIGKEMVLVPKGTFIMGSDTGFPDEKPRRTVFVDSFYIDVDEVSLSEYLSFLHATSAQKGPRSSILEKALASENRPATTVNGQPLPMDAAVMNVSWFAAQAHCEWRGLRLPQEKEWEKAARGQDGRDYPWGAEFDESAPHWIGTWNSAGPTQSSAFPRDVSPWGVRSLAGNVREWVLDFDDGYLNLSRPMDAGNVPFAVVRGGGFSTRSPNELRVSSRGFRHPAHGYSSLGFRCAAGLKELRLYLEAQSAAGGRR